MNHTCKLCGKKFVSPLNTVYCDDCKPKAKKIIVCKECGKEYEVGLGKNGQFLQWTVCQDCVKNRKKKVICKICGKEFELSKEGPKLVYPKRNCCYECKPEYTKELANSPDTDERILALWNRKKVKCETCGKIFVVEASKKRVNCDECKNVKQEEKTLTCKRCGKPFIVTRAKTVRNSFLYRDFCPDCLKPKEEKVLICKNCGKEFVVGRYENVEHKDFRRVSYCSDECRREGANKRKVATSLERFGVPYYAQTEEYKEKVNKTCLARYGVMFPCMSDNCQAAQKDRISLINKQFASLLDDFKVDYTQEFILSGKYSYDFLIGDTLLVEINPTISHSSINLAFDARDINFHLDKSVFAEKMGYKCIHIWQWDDWDKILNNFILPKIKIGARKTEIRYINDVNIIEAFLGENYVESTSGYIKLSDDTTKGNVVYLGLYFEGYLVQIMSFVKYDENTYVLDLLCSKQNCQVLGGTNRLFKFFIKKYKPDRVVSYCDFSKFYGSVFLNLGFVPVENTIPPYKNWSFYRRANNLSGRLSDFRQYSKQHITDDELQNSGCLSLFNICEEELNLDDETVMIKHDWLPIYDCGERLFLWGQ